MMDATLESVYFNPSHPGSFGGINSLARYSGVKDRKKLIKWLEKQEAYTLHKPVRYRFQRRRIIVPGIDHQWQADLVDLSRVKLENENIPFILTCIDVFSKYAWVVPLKTKHGKELVYAFEKILSLGRKPRLLQTDKGTEFVNKTFQSYLRSKNIVFFTTENDDIKASIVERFNRTLKTKMWKYFSHEETVRYIDVLQDLVHSYNHTYHRSIKRAPASVNHRNEKEVWYILYGEKHRSSKSLKIRYRVGDLVRISKTRRTFQRGYLPNWTEEIFTIDKVLPLHPPVYVLKDYNGEVLKGVFYEREIQKVNKDDDVYKIEKVLAERRRGRGKQVLVKWRGYPDSFNSWINKTAISII